MKCFKNYKKWFVLFLKIKHSTIIPFWVSLTNIFLVFGKLFVPSSENVSVSDTKNPFPTRIIFIFRVRIICNLSYLFCDMLSLLFCNVLDNNNWILIRKKMSFLVELTAEHVYVCILFSSLFVCCIIFQN